MSRLFSTGILQNQTKRLALYIQAAVLVAASFAPLLLTAQAGAAQLTTRSVTISTSEASATGVEYLFKFTPPTATPVQGIVFEFCTTPLSTCTKPTGMSVDHAAGAGVSGTQDFTQATAFTEYDADGSGDEGECDDADAGSSSTQYCVERTAAGNEAAADQKEITLTGIVNPSLAAANTTVYVRVMLYSDTAFATKVHEGTVAASINRQLTINGRVQEKLLFCVAAIDDGGATDTTLPVNMPACTALTDTVVDLGVIDNATIARSPVDNNPPSSQGNDKYGIAMVNTNAGSGVAVTYFAEEDSTGTEQLRAFRVLGATCNASGTNVFDQCFKSAVAGVEMVAGAEDFGLNVPCIIADDGGATVNSVQTTTMNLVVDGDYDNNGADTSPNADCENEATDYYYNWNDISTADVIATSPTVVDNEIIKLSFAATAQATTPTGLYTVVSTYIATATF